MIRALNFFFSFSFWVKNWIFIFCDAHAIPVRDFQNDCVECGSVREWVINAWYFRCFWDSHEEVVYCFVGGYRLDVRRWFIVWVASDFYFTILDFGRIINLYGGSFWLFVAMALISYALTMKQLKLSCSHLWSSFRRNQRSICLSIIQTLAKLLVAFLFWLGHPNATHQLIWGTMMWWQTLETHSLSILKEHE